MRRRPRIVGGRVLPGEFQLDVLVDDLESRLTPRVPRVGEQQFVECELLSHVSSDYGAELPREVRERLRVMSV